MPSSHSKKLTVLFVLVALFLVFSGDRFFHDQNNVPAKNETRIAIIDDGLKASTKAYPIVRVIDGDTIIVHINGKEERVRLIGIDTPETKHPEATLECFGDEASARTKELLFGKSVHLVLDTELNERDEYGRILAYVFVDQKLINEILIEEGFAKEYTFRGMPYKHQSNFQQAEFRAKESAVGLWGECVK